MALQKIKILDLTNDPNFVDTEDGNKVHELVATAFERGDNVELSFVGASQIITAFTNAVIGQLYNEFPEDMIKRKLKIVDVPEGFGSTIVRSINRGKRFYENKDEIGEIMSHYEG